MKHLKYLVFIGFLLIATSVSAAEFNYNLKYGMRKSAEVSKLQDFLIDQGFLTGSPTGNFYLQTLRAVKAFQTQNGIAATGYWGTLTRAKANDILDKEVAASSLEEAADPITTPTPTAVPADICNNIYGQQLELPPGMYRTTDNNCYTRIETPTPTPTPVDTPVSMPAPTPTPVPTPVRGSLYFNSPVGYGAEARISFTNQDDIPVRIKSLRFTSYCDSERCGFAAGATGIIEIENFESSFPLTPGVNDRTISTDILVSPNQTVSGRWRLHGTYGTITTQISTPVIDTDTPIKRQ